MDAPTSIAEAAATLVAAAPIGLSLALLLGVRMPGWRAGTIAWGCAAALAAAPASGGPAALARFALPWPRWWEANLRGVLLSVTVLYVLLFGLLLYNLLRRAGAIDAIATALAGATADPARQALLIVGGVSPFLESVSGFGLAIVIVAPLLLALGFDRWRATLVALLGQSAVPWGAMAIGTLIGGELTGLTPAQMGTGSAYLNAPLAVLYNVLAVVVAAGHGGPSVAAATGGRRSAATAGPAQVWRRLPDILLTSTALAFGLWAFSAWVSVELAGALAGLLAAGVAFAYSRWVERGARAAAMDVAATRAGAVPLWRAFVPYYVLIGGLLVSRVWPSLAAWLQRHAVLQAPALGFKLPLVYSPGFFLLLACLTAAAAFRLPATVILDALRATCRQWWPAAAATTSFIALSTVMYDAGMTPHLAARAATAVGSAFVWVSPFIGGLGGLMTGSNTGGNAMLIQFQTETARRAGLPADVLAYANNTAAANATMASPARVVLAATVTGQPGGEGIFLRAVLPVVAAALAVMAAHVRIWVELR